VGAEITVEANPETVGENELRQMLDAGVNRISLGIQSFSEIALQRLGRRHTPAQAREAVELARRAGFRNVGADLMFGLPDQGLAEWKADLGKALSLPLTHISCYELLLEKEAPLAKRGVKPPGQDLAADMWETAMDELPAAGYLHYEIANYARPGHCCMHNRKYWLDLDFLGCGAGAWECRGGERRANACDLARYFAGKVSNYPPAVVDEASPDLKMSETLILNLRLIEGCKEEEFQARYGTSSLEKLMSVLSPHIDAGRLERRDGRLRLTRRGLLCANEIWGDLLAAAT
jgi:oxygen-independent coproporphyrinogen-3 oxidase